MRRSSKRVPELFCSEVRMHMGVSSQNNTLTRTERG